MNNLKQFMPLDQVRLCNKKNICIEARGNNAKAIVFSLCILIVCIAAYYVSKIKR